MIGTMNHIVTEQAIGQKCRALQSALRNQVDSQLQSVSVENKALEDNFRAGIDLAGFSTNAFVPAEQLDFSADARQLPDGLFIGKLTHPAAKESFFPAILPFAQSNAIGLCLDGSNDDLSTDLMQMFAFRLLLSIPVEHAQFHFIDLHSYGKSSRHFNRLSEKITANAFVKDKQSLSSFITELEGLVSRLNHNVLAECKDLREFNADPSHIALKYHFVFIPHIDERIDRDTISRIYSLCSGMNASTCGIYVFYSLSPDYELTSHSNDPLPELLNISTLVKRGTDGIRLYNSPFGSDFESRYCIELETGMPHNLNEIVKQINLRADNVKPPVVSFDRQLEEMISGGDYWQGNTTYGIEIPIGRKGANSTVYFTLAGKTTNYFAMIGGRPGYGKTVLLHDIICNGSLIYSPKELEFYLIDCTNGTGFKSYEHLPHARFVSITRQREYTDSAIEHLIDEMYRRADLFKAASESKQEAIEKIETYREKTGETLPRILVIIDEFQVLLEKHDKLSRKIGSSLEKLIKEGRKYGISIVFCTQSFRNIDFDTEQITLRIAFNLKEADSLKVLGAGNDSAAHLSKRGEAIYNDKNGSKDGNIIFQAAYTEQLQRYVSFCAERWAEADCPKPKRFVFDGKAVSDLGNNLPFISALTSGERNMNYIKTYIGMPMFIREEHSFVGFRQAIGSNLLICGSDDRSAASTLALVNYQVSQLFALEDVQHQMLMIDYFSDSSEWSQYLKSFAEQTGISYLRKRDLDSTLDQLVQLLKTRINAVMDDVASDNTPVFLTIAYIQNAPDLKKNQFNQPSKTAAKIINLLNDGPDYGIHLIVYAYNYKGLTDALDSSAVPLFGNRIILQDGALGFQLADESKALAEGTALLVTEDKSTTYEHDPVMLYNNFNSTMLNDKTIDFIFSKYKERQ